MAILAVFFYHYAGGNANASTPFLRLLSNVFGLGWTGVDLFFVLSGFLITGILYDTRDDPAYYRKFYLRRALRIFPVYYLFILALVLTTPLSKAQWTLGHLFFLFYLGYPASLVWPELTRISSFLLITHLWSLSVEEQFYMVWPGLLRKLRSERAIVVGCALIAGSAIALRCVFLFEPGLSPTWSYAFLFCRTDQLAIGAAIAIAVRGRWMQTLLQWAPIALFFFAGIVVAMCVIRHTVDHSDPLLSSVGFTAIALMYGSLLASCLRSASVTESIFTFAPLRILGKYSYGLYIYHFPLSVFLSPLKDRFVSQFHSYVLGSIVHIMFCLAVNVGLAALSFHLFELPIMSRKNRFRYSAEDMQNERIANPKRQRVLESA